MKNRATDITTYRFIRPRGRLSKKCANPDTLSGQPSSSMSVQGTVIHKMDDEKWAGMLKNSLARDHENKVRRVG